MLELTDTHCHIQSAGQKRGERATRELWAKDPDITGGQLVERAVDAGVSRLICVGCELEDSELAVSFVSDKPQCWASIGIHPHEAKRYMSDDESFKTFAALINRPKVVAIGECGLDYFYEHSPKEDQLVMLEKQLDLAEKSGLPVIFHVREAFDDFWPVFDNYRNINGVLHSYTDNAKNLDKAVSKGLYIGVNGIATFAKQPEQIDVYRNIPLKNLLLETDAPFLTPVPHRGSMNEPMRIVTIAEYLSGLRHEPLEELASATTNNARTLFKLS